MIYLTHKGLFKFAFHVIKLLKRIPQLHSHKLNFLNKYSSTITETYVFIIQTQNLSDDHHVDGGKTNGLKQIKKNFWYLLFITKLIQVLLFVDRFYANQCTYQINEGICPIRSLKSIKETIDCKSITGNVPMQLCAGKMQLVTLNASFY